MACVNTWSGVTALAKDCGCRFFDLVAAQWALESGFGQHAPGENYYGLKGPGTNHKTGEFIAGEWVQINDNFMVFRDLGECTRYLVERWYKDFKGYQGVDRAPTIEAAAHELVRQGYATDPAYASKLLILLRDHGGQQESNQEERMTRFRANHATVLKKAPIDSRYLSAEGKRTVTIGDVIVCKSVEEIPASSHNWVTLQDNERWCIYQPHFSLDQSTLSTTELDWSNFACRIGKYLTVGEVLQYDARRRPRTGSEEEANILSICQQFDAIRQAWGGAIGVTSGYRPEPINRQVGGVSGSMHVAGRALDIYPIGRDIEAFHQWLICRWSGGYGDGRHRGFIHVDNRGGGRFDPAGGVNPWRVWTY